MAAGSTFHIMQQELRFLVRKNKRKDPGRQPAASEEVRVNQIYLI